MEFQLSNISQSQRYFKNVKGDMYNFAFEHSQKPYLSRASGPILAFGSALIDLSAKVSTIGETIIKGFANILGSPFFHDCHLSKGLKQLLIQLPLHLTALAFLPVKSLFKGVEITIGMALKPDFYSDSQRSKFKEEAAKLEAMVRNSEVMVKKPNTTNGIWSTVIYPPEKCDYLRLLYE